MVDLKDGTQAADPRLDRLPEFDERSRQFPVRALLGADLVKIPRSYTWGLTHWLDQGVEGRCVEFSICHEMLARPVLVERRKVDEILAAKAIYWDAQRNDQWEGGSYPGASPTYEGTSVLAGIKAAAGLGFYSAYDWAFGLRDLVLALGYHGPAVLGINWYHSMFNTDADGWLKVEGDVAGGHAILARGVKVVFTDNVKSWANLDYDRSYVLLHNSWGEDWGMHGTAKVSLTDMDRLLKEDGECCLPRTRVR